MDYFGGEWSHGTFKVKEVRDVHIYVEGRNRILLHDQ